MKAGNATTTMEVTQPLSSVVTVKGGEDAAEIREFPVRFTDIDFFDHMNNSVYWSVVEDYLYNNPELLSKPLRVTIEHDAAVGQLQRLFAAFGDGSSADDYYPQQQPQYTPPAQTTPALMPEELLYGVDGATRTLVTRQV